MIYAALQQNTLLKTLSDADLEYLSLAATPLPIRQGNHIFRQNELIETIYVIETGCIRLVQQTLDGTENTLGTFVQGDALGLLNALIGERALGSAEAVVNSHYLSLPKSALWEVMARHPQLGVGIVRLMGSQLREAHQQLQDLHLARVEQRLARILDQGLQQPEVSASSGLKMALSQSSLAQQSGTTPEAVRYILDRWERSGIVLVGRDQLNILNPEALRAMADDRIVGFK